ncbi:MAG: YfcE family phosphodiesterase, partial [Spirochaetales bacterium]
HCAYWEETGGTLLLNPGSCSRSRSKHPPGFAVVSFPGEQNRFDITYFGIEKSVFKNHTFIPMPIHSD